MPPGREIRSLERQRLRNLWRQHTGDLRAVADGAQACCGNCDPGQDPADLRCPVGLFGGGTVLHGTVHPVPGGLGIWCGAGALVVQDLSELGALDFRSDLLFCLLQLAVDLIQRVEDVWVLRCLRGRGDGEGKCGCASQGCGCDATLHGNSFKRINKMYGIPYTIMGSERSTCTTFPFFRVASERFPRSRKSGGGMWCLV